MNLDEVVAIGAALQGGVLSGDVGCAAAGRDAADPGRGDARRGRDGHHRAQHDHPGQEEPVFSTAEDNQSAVTIHVLQGERPLAADNMSLGQFNLEGIPPALRGMPQVEVTLISTPTAS